MSIALRWWRSLRSWGTWTSFCMQSFLWCLSPCQLLQELHCKLQYQQVGPSYRGVGQHVENLRVYHQEGQAGLARWQSLHILVKNGSNPKKRKRKSSQSSKKNGKANLVRLKRRWTSMLMMFVIIVERRAIGAAIAQNTLNRNVIQMVCISLIIMSFKNLVLGYYDISWGWHLLKYF